MSVTWPSFSWTIRWVLWANVGMFVDNSWVFCDTVFEKLCKFSLSELANELKLDICSR